jgi:hypothetical protein
MQSTRQPKSKLGVLALIGACVFFFSNGWTDNTQEMPKAISKADAKATALHWLAERQETGKVTQVMFDSDTDLSVAVQHRGNWDAYTKKLKSTLPMDTYVVELQTKAVTYRVSVDYEHKKVVGWRTLELEAKPSDPKLAEAFLRSRGFSDLKRANKLEDVHLSYTIGRSFDGMPLVAKVRTDNGKIADYKLYLRIKGSILDWKKQQEVTRSKLESLSLYSTVGAFGLALLLALVWNRRLAFSRGWLLALLVFAIQMVNVIIIMPLLHLLFEGKTAGIDIANSILNQAMYYAGMSVLVYLAFVAGDYAWKLVRKKDETYAFSERPRNMYWLAIAVIGVQSLIYVVGDWLFDVWSTNDAFFALDNLSIPELFPLSAWAAAISEEVIYRLFLFSTLLLVFRKIVGGRTAWVGAALLSSLCWALGHAGYPVFPALSRIVEVTALGFVFSAIFYRYGLVASMMAHAVIDSFLMAIGILYLPDAHLGLDIPLVFAYTFLPLAVMLLLLRRRRTVGDGVAVGTVEVADDDVR